MHLNFSQIRAPPDLTTSNNDPYYLQFTFQIGLLLIDPVASQSPNSRTAEKYALDFASHCVGERAYRTNILRLQIQSIVLCHPYYCKFLYGVNNLPSNHDIFTQNSLPPHLNPLPDVQNPTYPSSYVSIIVAVLPAQPLSGALINDAYDMFWNVNSYFVHKDYFFSHGEDMVYFGVTRMNNGQIPSSIMSTASDTSKITPFVYDIVYETRQWDIEQLEICREQGLSECGVSAVATTSSTASPSTQTEEDEAFYEQFTEVGVPLFIAIGCVFCCCICCVAAFIYCTMSSSKVQDFEKETEGSSPREKYSSGGDRSRRSKRRSEGTEMTPYYDDTRYHSGSRGLPDIPEGPQSDTSRRYKESSRRSERSQRHDSHREHHRSEGERRRNGSRRAEKRRPDSQEGSRRAEKRHPDSKEVSRRSGESSRRGEGSRSRHESSRQNRQESSRKSDESRQEKSRRRQESSRRSGESSRRNPESSQRRQDSHRNEKPRRQDSRRDRDRSSRGSSKRDERQRGTREERTRESSHRSSERRRGEHRSRRTDDESAV